MYGKTQYIHFPYNTVKKVSENFILPINIAVSALSLWSELPCSLFVIFSHSSSRERQALVQLSEEETMISSLKPRNLPTNLLLVRLKKKE